MKTNRLLTILNLLLIFSFIKAQKISPYQKEEVVEQLRKEKMYVLYTDDKEMDEALKYAFDKYWKINHVQFIKREDFEKLKRGKDYEAYFEFNNWAYKDYGDFSYTNMNITYKSTLIYVGSFDKFSKGKNEEIGIDKDFHMMSTKIVQYIHMMNSEFSKLESLGRKKYFYFNLKDKIKEKNLVIAKEYFSAGLSEANFGSLYKNKYSILNSDEIKKKIMEEKELDNCAELFICGSPEVFKGFIVDLKTGDVMAEATVGKTSFNRTRQIDDSVMEKLLNKLLE
jgi:hypothetical protein